MPEAPPHDASTTTVKDLQERLKVLGCKVRGKKEELIERLREASLQAEEGLEAEEASEAEASEEGLEAESPLQEEPNELEAAAPASEAAAPAAEEKKVVTLASAAGKKELAGKEPGAKKDEDAVSLEALSEADLDFNETSDEALEAEDEVGENDIVEAEVAIEVQGDVQAAGAEGGGVSEEQRRAEEQQAACRAVLSLHYWKKAGVRSLVKTLLAMGKVGKEELPAKPTDIEEELLVKLCGRFTEGIEEPLGKFKTHLRPALSRRVLVGTLDNMGQESCRRSFDFLETTDTWHDTDSAERSVQKGLRVLGCGYQDPGRYTQLAERAAEGGFKIVVKVSHVATHVLRLAQCQDWWPRLYKEKYCKLAKVTAAYLWQFAPSWSYSTETMERLERLADYLNSNASGAQHARHIVDFRDGSWYREEVYEFLRQKRWCLAWLHLNNTGWASSLPNGWTDRVQTTDFCFCRLFGPDGAAHGYYDKAFLHELYESCPVGSKSYVLFGNRETLLEKNPEPVPAVSNAAEWRTIFTKMDLVERVKLVREAGDCPRALSTEEQLLVNAFYLRFSRKARTAGVTMASPVAAQQAQKYKKRAAEGKRCFEWYFPTTKTRLHLSLHDAKEEEDLWLHLRQLTGFEDIECTRQWSVHASRSSGSAQAYDEGGWFDRGECQLVSGSLVRFSEAARKAGLLRGSDLKSFSYEAWKLEYLLANGDELKLSPEELSADQDLWTWFLDFSRVPSEALSAPAEEQEANPFQDGSWRSKAGEMWQREQEETRPEASQEANNDSWWKEDSWKDTGKSSWGDSGGDKWWEKSQDSWGKAEDWSWKRKWDGDAEEDKRARTWR